MRQVLVIRGRLDGLNEHDAKNRACRYRGASSKKDQTHLVEEAARITKLKPMKSPVRVHIEWYEGIKPDGKRFVPRDKDNIRHGAKYILDGLVKAGILEDDGFRHIESLSDEYMIDVQNPRIVINLTNEESQ